MTDARRLMPKRTSYPFLEEIQPDRFLVSAVVMRFVNISPPEKTTLKKVLVYGSYRYNRLTSGGTTAD
jgi:hypothetical protein